MKYENQYNFLFIFLIVLFSPCLCKAISSDTVKKKHVYYSREQMTDEKEWTNFKTYPRPNISDSAMYELLKPYAVYPELAKKNYLTHTVFLRLDINEKGKIEAVNLLSEPYPLFDT